MILLRTSGTLRCFPHSVYINTSFLRASTWTLIWDVVTSQHPLHCYSLGPRKSIYVPAFYQMSPPLWDRFVTRVESLSYIAWEVTTWLDGQAEDLDIREGGKPCAPNITTSVSSINPIVVVPSTHLSLNPLCALCDEGCKFTLKFYTTHVNKKLFRNNLL